MKYVFVVNAGSSSLKYQIMEMEAETVLVSGLCDRIGQPSGRITYKTDARKWQFDVPLTDHAAAIETLLGLLQGGETKVLDDIDRDILAVGHRLTFGDTHSVEITPEVRAAIESRLDMFPLHLPAMMAVLDACQRVLPNATQVSVYDNSFHLTMPPKAYIYPIPYEYYERYGYRRTGFHSTSFRYLIGRLGELTGRDPGTLKVVACHLGNGASIAAIKNGRCIDTTMGYTALAGIMMGTRSGDVDPSLLISLMENQGLSAAELKDMLYNRSGFLGVSGVSNDERDVIAAVEAGSERAKLACDIHRYQIKKQIGAYVAALGGIDYLVFSGGMGERSEGVREDVCSEMECFGIELDALKNRRDNGREVMISKEGSRTPVWIIPTNEELIIARDAYRIHCGKSAK